MPARPVATEIAALTLEPMQINTLMVRITGLTPLVINNMWNKEILDRNPDKPPQAGRQYLPPETHFNNARYILQSGSDGFKAVSLKNAMITAVSMYPKLTKVYMRQVFFVNGEFDPVLKDQFIPIIGEPRMREDVVRLNTPGNPPDLRYRPEYWPWAAVVQIDYNSKVISQSVLTSLLTSAGWSVGIGENRPQKSGGDWGRFRIE